mmetsp:Transcript_21913/g.38782  ORF Transcript_21913/g.38782 Transcript_21913/m.38782 type:complete len:93 (-) Transcript_21913:27-305(-)
MCPASDAMKRCLEATSLTPRRAEGSDPADGRQDKKAVVTAHLQAATVDSAKPATRSVRGQTWLRNLVVFLIAEPAEHGLMAELGNCTKLQGD